MREPAVLGVDLSLRGLGLFVCPLGWDMCWERCSAETLGVDLPKGATEQQRVMRLRDLMLDVRTFAVYHAVRHVFVESYAYGMNTSAHSLGELGGVVKLELLRELPGVTIATANQGAARKLVFGCAPPKGLTDKARKAWVLEPLLLAGAKLRDHDQGDALVACHWGLAQLGAPHLQNLLGSPEHFEALRKQAAREKAKAKRRKAAPEEAA